MFQNRVTEEGGAGAKGREGDKGQTAERFGICFSGPWEATEKFYGGE